MHLSPPPPVAKAAVRLKAVVLLLFIYCLMYFTLFLRVLYLSLFWNALACVLSSFATILKRKRRELVALLLLSYECLVIVIALWSFSRCRALVSSV